MKFYPKEEKKFIPFIIELDDEESAKRMLGIMQTYYDTADGATRYYAPGTFSVQMAHTLEVALRNHIANNKGNV